ncbi:hypothetical protein [Agriterribacter sp.]|uniref:hypothetical protein n=1 Tax=Agriterribacter sp. TaxID=2821509 RepID=UPI002BF72E5A|nr:hypothetical protein [Agriterribacter sp.]HRO47429.1 hypothetical protein [Agriterribacter sp.]HRQ15914.1 hypothetical protein [Agriterribacter sp.]
MKKIILLLVIAVSTLYMSQVYAQKHGKPFSFGFGFEGGPIIGNADFKEVFSSEFGLSLRFSVKAGPGYATFSPGALLVMPKSLSEDDIKIGTHIPLRLGYKYIFAERFFVMGEAGYAAYTVYSADAGSESDEIVKDKSGGFTYAPSVGVNLGKFEAGIRYEATHLKDSDTKIGLLGLRLGFNF